MQESTRAERSTWPSECAIKIDLAKTREGEGGGVTLFETADYYYHNTVRDKENLEAQKPKVDML